MARTTDLSRRHTLALMASTAGLLTVPALAQGMAKPMRGVMPIVVTPYMPDGAVDFADLAKQMVFYDRCGCSGGYGG